MKRYLRMVSAEEAYSLIMKEFESVKSVETIRTSDAIGRALAESVYAATCIPNCNQAAMDGFAVVSKSTFSASSTQPARLRIGEDAFPINTGDVMPPGADAVVKIEDVRVEGDALLLWESIAPYQNVRLIGEDVAKGDLLFPKDWCLRVQDVALCVSCAVFWVKVYKLPTLCIIPTGEEIVPEDLFPKKGEVVESNSILIKGALSEFCKEIITYPIVPDDEGKIKEAMKSALQKADILCIIAGSSAGRKDFVPHLLQEEGELLFHGILMMPAKPFGAGKLLEKPVFCIPGYPVSCFFAVLEFLLPLFSHISGKKMCKFKKKKAQILQKIHSELGVKEHRRGLFFEKDGLTLCTPYKGGAGNLSSITFSNSFFTIPAEQEGIKEGEEIDVFLMDESEEILFTGSHDPALDILKEMLWEKHKVLLLIKCVGSMGGLYALKRGACHITACHLLDPETGVYNKKYIQQICDGMDVEVVPFLLREQGFLVKKGNPKNIKGVEDLLRVRIANRQRGAGTRLLLDYLLKKEGIEPEKVPGYSLELPTHTAVAAAVQEEVVDVALGVKVAADTFGLDFIKVAEEHYELVFCKKDKEKLSPLLSIISSDEFKDRIKSLGHHPL